MKKILLSLAMIGVVGSLTVGATSAIFSDDEISTGNTFTAGAVDLTIDNESYYNGELNEGTTWLEARNLDDGQGPADGAYLFFNFDDVKPGDWGEDTISLHINDNPSWACVDVTLRSNDDNGLTEPEADDGDVTGGVGEGELADAINFMWWADDGDNVFEDDETLLPAGTFGGLTINEPVTIALADASGNIWDGEGPMPGDEVRYIGKAWCLGDMNADPVAQDDLGNEGDNGPLDRGTGFTCNGAPVDNVTQTDSMTADIAFHVEQARHNEGFLCEPLPDVTTITVTKIVENDDGDAVVEDFDLFINDLQVTSGVAQEVLPGTYTISEEGPAGYNAVFTGDCDANGEITIAEFEQLSCTITNTEIVDPVVTMDKLVAYSSPGLSVDPNNFPFTLTNDSTLDEYVFNDEVPAALPAGTYTITETYIGVQNISFGATFSGDCSEIGTSDTGTITVVEGETYNCQVLNQISVAGGFNGLPNGQQIN